MVFIFIVLSKGIDIMIKIALCDSSVSDIDRATDLICSFFNNTSVTESFCLIKYSSGEELLQAINDNQFDLFLLEIELADQHNGLYYANAIRMHNPSAIILLVSANIKYARFGYLVDALRFIYKPNMEKELHEALNIAVERIICNNVDHFILSFRGDYYSISLHDILYAKKENRSISVYTIDGLKLQSSLSLKALYAKLDPLQFVYVNKGCIVNLVYTDYIKKDQIKLNGVESPLFISRKYSSTVRKTLSQLFM